VRTDPSGRSIWGKYVGRHLGNAVKVLGQNRIGGPFARVFLGPVMGVMGFLARPMAFFKSLGRNYGMNGIVLAGTVALEAVTDQYEFSVTYRQAFVGRLVGDVIGGVANSAIGATRNNFHRFNKRTFYDGLEYTLGGVFYTRFMAARGYRPPNNFTWDARSVYDEWVGERENLGSYPEESHNSALVYRVRSALGDSSRTTFARGPIGDFFGVGLYHDELIAVARDKIYVTAVGRAGFNYGTFDLDANADGINLPKFQDAIGQGRAELRGRYEVRYVRGDFRDNPLGIKAASDGLYSGRNSYLPVVKNCQRHANAVLYNLSRR